ncbi:MAG: sirohydrochlorin cobaltochelatase [Desulfobacteraceae bacterium]|nr:sirohydrochlorin cobaltochelatase [Desulfobacteraceae bacterium]
MQKTIKDIPIILTAFGTTEKAFSTYDKMNNIFKNTFPNNSIHWSFSSRIVKHIVKQKKDIHLKNPVEMALSLQSQGHKWVVMQSLHLICGHEFDRFISERNRVNIRSTVGLPLLTTHDDYIETAKALATIFPQNKNQAVVLVGHGTDHPAWTAYLAIESILRAQNNQNIFVGVIEGYPDKDITIERIKKAGYKKVCLIPLMIVAGVHFKEDLTTEKDSWQKTFERHNIEVSVVDQGIGYINEISSIFCNHISDALDVIPL